MTPDQQRETTLRLYRLAWRFPEQAPEPKMTDFGVHSRAACTSFHPAFHSVAATCIKNGVCIVTVAVGSIQEIHVSGTAGYVETMLRAIPYSLRPHVGVSE